jgi:hypothetical protein
VSEPWLHSGEDDVTKVGNALDVARASLDTTYTDAEWQTAWEGCVDRTLAP